MANPHTIMDLLTERYIEADNDSERRELSKLFWTVVDEQLIELKHTDRLIAFVDQHI